MGQAIHRVRAGLWGLALVLCLGLGGCFQADLTLRFDHQTHGTLRQSIQLGERGMALAQTALQPWMADLRPAIQRLGGHLEQTADTIAWEVPFSTGADLVDRFNQVFDSSQDEGRADNAILKTPAAAWMHAWKVPGLGEIPYQLAIDQATWPWGSRMHLSYDLDLQSLASLENNGEGRNSPTLGFRLETPWGLSRIADESTPPTDQGATAALWQLTPGQIYRIEVWFWVPNLVALGALAIAIAVVLGYVLRYRVLGPPGSPR